LVETLWMEELKILQTSAEILNSLQTPFPWLHWDAFDHLLWCVTYAFIYALLGFELSDLNLALLSRLSIAWAMPLALFALVI
jgi:hypothetical protein